MEKKKLKKNYLALYISLLVILAVVAVNVVLRSSRSVPIPEAKPLNGFVMEDASMLFLGNDYTVVLLSGACEERVVVDMVSMMARDVLDAIIVSADTRNTRDMLEKLLTVYPVTSVLLPEACDKAYSEDMMTAHPACNFATMSRKQSWTLGDMLLRHEAEQSFLLTHGANTFLFAYTPLRSGIYTMAYLADTAAGSSIAADYAFLQKPDASLAGSYNAIMELGVSYQFYCDGTEFYLFEM